MRESDLRRESVRSEFFFVNNFGCKYVPLNCGKKKQEKEKLEERMKERGEKRK